MKQTKAQLKKTLKEMGVEFDKTLKTAELQALVDAHKNIGSSNQGEQNQVPEKKKSSKIELQRPGWVEEQLWDQLSEKGKAALCQGSTVPEATEL